MPFCLTCGAGVDEYDSAYYSRNMLCIPCYTRKASEIPMVSCTRCGVRVRQEEARRKGGGSYCNYCASELERIERTPPCPICKKPLESWQKSMRAPDGRLLHISCAESYQRKKMSARCIRCGRGTSFYKVTQDNLVVCLRCEREPIASGRGTLLHAMVDRIGAMIG